MYLLYFIYLEEIVLSQQRFGKIKKIIPFRSLFYLKQSTVHQLAMKFYLQVVLGCLLKVVSALCKSAKSLVTKSCKNVCYHKLIFFLLILNNIFAQNIISFVGLNLQIFFYFDSLNQ